MAQTQVDDRQVVNRAALSTAIGSTAGASLDSIFSLIDSKMVNLASTQTLTNKTLAFLQTNVITDSTTTGSAATLQSGDIADGVVRLTNASLVSVSGIPAGGAGQHIVIENQTGNTITVNNNDSGATAANRIFTGTGGNLSVSPNVTLAFTYDTVVSRWMLTGGSGSGSGSGGTGKNYLSVYTASTSSNVPNTGNGNAEAGSTTGFSLGTIGTLTNGLPTGSPTFGSGASGNLTLGVVSSGQLAGSYSFSYTSSAATTAGNMMASSAFFIDTEDQGKVLGYKLYYSVPSGATTGNFSGTSSNSFAVAAYDVTNSAWLPVAGAFNLIQNSGVGIASGTFQTSISTAQIRFVLYNANATTGAITLYLDDISVGPFATYQGPAMTDLVTTSLISVQGFGTVIDASYQMKREGDMLIVQGSALSGTTSATIASITIPYSIDYTKLQTITGLQAVGEWRNITPTGPSNVATSSGPNSNPIFSDASTANQVFLTIQAGSQQMTKLAGSTILTSTSTFSFNFRVPIVGWSSNTSMSSDTDTRVCAAAFYSSANNASSTTQTINFDTKLFDTHGAVTASAAGTGTWKFTAPITGFYRVTCPLTLTTSAEASIQLYKNGSVFVGEMGATEAADGRGLGAATVSLNSGDYIDIRTSASLSLIGGTYSATNTSSVYIERLSGPAVIAATESVNAKYGTSVSTSIGTSDTLVPFATAFFDTHNAYNTSTGIYTIPVSGKYRVSSKIQSNAITFTLANQDNQIKLYKNGSLDTVLAEQVIQTTGTYATAANGTTTISCLAGDTLSIYAIFGVSGTLNGVANRNYVCFERIGN